MFVMKKALPRRTFLRGLGVTLGLPFLDAMVPAMSTLAAAAGKPVTRLGIVYRRMELSTGRRSRPRLARALS